MHRPAPRDAQFLGFDEAVVTQDPKWGPWLEWIEAAHPEHFRTALAMCWPRWPCLPYPPQREAAAAARQRIIEPLRQASGWQFMYPSPLPAELHDTVFITDQAQAFIRRQVAARPDQPSCATSPTWIRTTDKRLPSSLSQPPLRLEVGTLPLRK